MADKTTPRLLWAVLAGWALLNWLQAALTPADPDEAYYRLYSLQPAWGYFDHPPMLALIIAAGRYALDNAFGIRLLLPLLQAVSVGLIWRLAGSPQEPRRFLLLAAILGAMPMFEVYGFIAAPDAPLLFFGVLFFVAYRFFLQKPGLTSALWLGACMAALLYSKYHGVLLIFFTLLSNLSLLRQPWFYVASFFGFGLFFPHLYWQFAHEFPSFRYHLQGRDDPYELKHTVNYLINQVVIFSPLLFPLWVMALARRRPADQLERAYYFVIGGFLLFFLWTTSKGHVEPQWTCLLSIPLAILLFRYSDGRPVFTAWLWRLSLLSIALILIFRIALAVDALRPAQLNKQFLHKTWVQALLDEAGTHPVVFQNSYRLAAVYALYTGQTAYTFTDADYRKSQFDIWEGEKALQHKKVLIAAQKDLGCPGCKTLKKDRQQFKLYWLDSLEVTQKVQLEAKTTPADWFPGKQVSLPVAFFNPYPHSIALGKGENPIGLAAMFFANNEDVVFASAETALRVLPPGDTVTATLHFRVPPRLWPGPYHWALGLKTGALPPAVNSRTLPVTLLGK